MSKKKKCHFLNFDIFPEFVSFKYFAVMVLVYIIILNKYLISYLII